MTTIWIVEWHGLGDERGIADVFASAASVDEFMEKHPNNDVISYTATDWIVKP